MKICDIETIDAASPLDDIDPTLPHGGNACRLTTTML
jgi:hypothetical protein